MTRATKHCPLQQRQRLRPHRPIHSRLTTTTRRRKRRTTRRRLFKPLSSKTRRWAFTAPLTSAFLPTPSPPWTGTPTNAPSWRVD